jgi:hypothetical protein
MDERALHRLSVQAFQEMLVAGITTVGEFHYLHHDSSKKGYAFDEVMLRAAKDAGIRIALLNSYYRTGGVDQPLAGGQLRFRTESPAEYWEQFDRLAGKIDAATQSLGVAPHSIRAAPIEDIVQLHDEAARRGLVFHMHVEEQPRDDAGRVGLGELAHELARTIDHLVRPDRHRIPSAVTGPYIVDHLLVVAGRPIRKRRWGDSLGSRRPRSSIGRRRRSGIGGRPRRPSSANRAARLDNDKANSDSYRAGSDATCTSSRWMVTASSMAASMKASVIRRLRR